MSRQSHIRVSDWLTNFKGEHLATATMLVDALQLVSATEVRTDLGLEIRRLLTAMRAPVAAFPVREVRPPESAHGDGHDGSYDLLPPGLPGSEAVIANILTGISREPAYKKLMITSLDLANLRTCKARTILLVDDFSGSGKRLKNFGKALRRHPTIRSWLSYGWVKIHVVAYAATAEATRLLRSDFGPDNVHLVRACPTFENAGWTPEQATDVEALCKYYCGSLKNYRYGFRKSKALIAFEHTAPNNLPAILWRVDDGWRSLFEWKAVPHDLLALYAAGPPASPSSSKGDAPFDRLGQVLQMIGRRVRAADLIVDATRFSYAEVSRLLNAARTFGLVTPELRLTDAGRKELRRWRVANKPLILPNQDDAYYPSQLRAGR